VIAYADATVLAPITFECRRHHISSRSGGPILAALGLRRG